VSVTLCIPSFNRANLVSETLDSVLAQTRTDWEAIVVEDGSTDNSADVIAAFAARDPRIRLMARDREPKGAAACRNIAVARARGRYVMFLDTDDLLAPFCLEQRVAVMDSNPGVDFSIFPMVVFEKIPGLADRLWNIDTGEDDLVRLLHLDPICPGTGTLWRRESFERVGMWDEESVMWQDIDLHVRAFTGGYKFVKRMDLPPDVFIRETDASMSRGSYHSRQKLEGRERVLKKVIGVLRNAGRSDLVPEMRYVCGAIALGATRSGNLAFARDLRRWAANEGVLDAADLRRLRFADALRVSRLDRLGSVRKVLDGFATHFSIDTPLGKIPVGNPPSAG
jgi:glycosyltransferase involved in cell wall biosynthesis